MCENRDGWLVAWGLCGCMLIRSSTAWLLPFTLLYRYSSTHNGSDDALFTTNPSPPTSAHHVSLKMCNAPTHTSVVEDLQVCAPTPHVPL